MAFTDDSGIRRQDSSRVFSAVSRNDLGRDLAWDYVQQNFEAMAQQWVLGDKLTHGPVMKLFVLINLITTSIIMYPCPFEHSIIVWNSHNHASERDINFHWPTPLDRNWLYHQHVLCMLELPNTFFLHHNSTGSFNAAGELVETATYEFNTQEQLNEVRK